MSDIKDKLQEGYSFLKSKFAKLKKSKKLDDNLKKVGVMLTEREMLKNVDQGFLKDPEGIAAAAELAKFQAEIKLIKEQGVKGIQGIIDAAGEVEKEIGILRASAKGGSKTDGELKVKYPSEVKDLLRGLNLMIEAGLVSKSDFKLSAVLEKELGSLAVKIESSLSGLAELTGKLTASATLFDLSKGNLLKVLVQAEVGFKISAKALSSTELKASDKLKITAAVVGEVVLTGQAVAKGEANLCINKVVLSGSAKAMAEGKATVKAIAGIFTVGDLGLEAEIGIDANAKASAEASGTFTIDPMNGNIAIGGTLKAEASAGAYGFAKGGIKCKDKVLLSTTFKGGVSTGVGGGAAGLFAIQNGVLTIRVDCSAAFEGGGEGEAIIEVDLKSTAKIIKEQATKEYSLWQKFTIEDGKTYFRMDDSMLVPIEDETYNKYTEILQEKLNDKFLKKLAGWRNNIKNEDKGKQLISETLEAALNTLYKLKGFDLTEERVKEDRKVRSKINEKMSKSLAIKIEDMVVYVEDLKVVGVDGWHKSSKNKKKGDKESLL